MPRFAYVNGCFSRHSQAHVHIEDRGFQFADGIYEVVALINGHWADERGHLDRLERSLKELSIDMPVPRETLRMLMRELARKNRLRSGNVYIQITRGRARRDFKFPGAATHPSLVMTAYPFKFDNNANVTKGARAISTPDIRWKRPDIKSTALLPQVLAKQAAAEKGAYEAWMVDANGYVTEGSSSNAWIVKGGKIITRPADGTILRGVTRTAIAKICAELQITLEERAFTLAEACEADEAFNTGAVALIVPIIELDGHKIGTGQPGPVAQRIYEEYRAYANGERGEQEEWKA